MNPKGHLNTSKNKKKNTNITNTKHLTKQKANEMVMIRNKNNKANRNRDIIYSNQYTHRTHQFNT